MQDGCLFCEIANRTIPSDIVYEDEKVIAFKDIDPQAPVHFVIIPTAHYDSVLNIAAGNDIISHMHTVAIRLVIKYNIAQSGFRLVNNCGPDAGQSVRHLHYHLLGGRKMSWPPG